jgi:hypothetical protein
MKIEQIVPEIIPSDSLGLAQIKNKAYAKPYLSSRLISKDGKLTWILLKLLPFPENASCKEGHETISAEMKVGQQVNHILSKKQIYCYQSSRSRDALFKSSKNGMDGKRSC